MIKTYNKAVEVQTQAYVRQLMNRTPIRFTKAVESFINREADEAGDLRTKLHAASMDAANELVSFWEFEQLWTDGEVL